MNCFLILLQKSFSLFLFLFSFSKSLLNKTNVVSFSFFLLKIHENRFEELFQTRTRWPLVFIHHFIEGKTKFPGITKSCDGKVDHDSTSWICVSADVLYLHMVFSHQHWLLYRKWAEIVTCIYVGSFKFQPSTCFVIDFLNNKRVDISSYVNY